MGQNAPYLCTAKRVAGHGVDSNYIYFMVFGSSRKQEPTAAKFMQL
mgnify:CR=1 FL=1